MTLDSSNKQAMCENSIIIVIPPMVLWHTSCLQRKDDDSVLGLHFLEVHTNIVRIHLEEIVKNVLAKMVCD